MPSLIRDPKDKKRVQFTSPVDGKRKTIRLGEKTVKQAKSFITNLDNLIASYYTGNIDPITAKWLTCLPDRLHAKFVQFGLTQARVRADDESDEHGVLLGCFLDDYIKSRTDLKPASLVNLGHTKRNLLGFFTNDKPIEDITPGDADQWRIWLKEQELSS